MQTSKIGCVLMASGLGKRFGGNKLMADFGGAPMIARAIAATESIPNRVAVTRHADVADYCRERGIPVLLHELPYRSDTVRLGLESLLNVDGCLFCPCDQPLLSMETVSKLIAMQEAFPDAILRPMADGQPGAPILFPKQFFPELLNLPQGKGGSFVVKMHPEQVQYLPVADSFELMDADTPEALAQLRSRMK